MLSGTFDTMPLTDVVQWIHSARASGRLTVTAALEDTLLVFSAGDLVGVGSDDPLRFDLGQALLAEGRIQAETLQDAVRAGGGPRGVEAALVQQGAVDAETLAITRRAFVQELILDLFLHEEGSFLFTSEGSRALLPLEDTPALHPLDPPVATQQLLLDSLRRVDEWRRILATFPSAYVTVRARPGTSDNAAWRVLKEAGGLVSIGDLCLRLGRSRFQVYQLLHDAWKAGLVEVDESWAEPTVWSGAGSAQDLLRNARLLIDERQFEEAREVLATALSIMPESRTGHALLRELRVSQLEFLYQQVPPHRVPMLAVPRQALREFELSPQETYLASRLEAGLDVATLIVATPLGELDTLRALRKFLHAGIVKLR